MLLISAIANFRIVILSALGLVHFTFSSVDLIYNPAIMISNNLFLWIVVTPFVAYGIFQYRKVLSLNSDLMESTASRKFADALLRDIIECLSVSIIAYDADERLILSNSATKKLFPASSDLLKLGTHRAELFRHSIDRGMLNLPEESQELADELMKLRSHPRGSTYEMHLANGKWLQCVDTALAGGGLISTYTDVTELKGAAEELRDAIESMRDGFVLWDSDDRIVLCNEHYHNMRLGEVVSDNIIGKHFDELTSARAGRGLLQLDSKETASEWTVRRKRYHQQPTEIPFALRFKNGQQIEIREHRTPGGGCVSVYIDVTERVKAQQEIEASEAKFRGFLEAAPDPIIAIDETFNIILASKQAEKLFGYTIAELIGQSVEILVPLRFRESHNAASIAYLKSPTVRSMGDALELSGVRKDGTEFPVEISLSPHQTPEGLVVLAAVRDLTQRHKVEEMLRRAQKMESLGTLAGGIAHDLNNVLVPIMGLTEFSISTLPPERKERKMLEDVLRSADRAKELVAQILSFSRQESVSLSDLDLGQATKAAVKLISAAVPPNILLEVDIGSEELHIRGNETQIHQVIMNLVNNAVQALGVDQGKIWVTLYADTLSTPEAISIGLPAGAYACLSVVDTGSGIDDAILERIFDPFFTTKNVGEGTGLGLSIIHGIVGSHGGAIKVINVEGKGARFDVYFPRIVQTA
ncbi:MAG: PAS-domain containing protein [Parvibaculum sp.]|nr:PAS-domain containing protein [Parvibaculum sp.]